MNKEEIVNELIKLSERFGVVEALYGLLGKSVSVRVPFSRKGCDTSIDELEFSVRAGNALKRAGIFTIGEAIDLIAAEGLLQIRNLGKKTQNEIKTRILVFGYQQLNENEKKRFFYDVLDKNCIER